MDVTDLDNIRAVTKAKEVFGRIDVLVNNAGYGTIGAIKEKSCNPLNQNSISGDQLRWIRHLKGQAWTRLVAKGLNQEKLHNS